MDNQNYCDHARNKDEILLPLVAGRWGEDQVGSYSQAGNIFRATLVNQDGNKMTVGYHSY